MVEGNGCPLTFCRLLGRVAAVVISMSSSNASRAQKPDLCVSKSAMCWRKRGQGASARGTEERPPPEPELATDGLNSYCDGRMMRESDVRDAPLTCLSLHPAGGTGWMPAPIRPCCLEHLIRPPEAVIQQWLNETKCQQQNETVDFSAAEGCRCALICCG